METLTSDVTLALRNLMKRPLFTGLAIVTLALGIGANAAIFAVVNAVLLDPLPFPDSESLYVPWASNPELARQVGLPDALPHSPGVFYGLQAASEGFESMALMGVLRANMTGDGDPEQVFGVNVTGNFFRVFRVPAHLGRTLEPGDEDAGEHAAVLSFGFWQRRFGGDPDVIGRAIQLDGEPVVVVGVMPESFTFPSGGDLPAGFGFAPVTHLWLPLQLDEEMRQNRGLRAYAPVGRARDGWSASELQAEMTTIGERFAAEYPETDRGWSFTATRLREQIIGDVRPSLLILSSAVGLVFLIACANVTNLVLAKALERQREVAVKTALGATRWRILRELVTEGLVLTGAAGLLGVVVASWILTLAPHVPFYLPYAGSLDARGTVAFFTLAVSLVTGLFLGVLPQWIVTPHAGEQLKDGARTSGTRRGHRLRGALVISEIAIASMLLVGAGLLVKSFVQLIAVDPGFRPDGALTFELLLPDTKYEPVERAAFYRELEERLAAAPGVVAAGAITSLPMDGTENLSPFVVEGQPPPEPDNAVMTDVRVATPGYFEAMRIPLLSGRTFRAGDDRTTSDVAIIDETMARLAWPGEDPIGKRFITGMRFDDDDRWATVVGVVGHVRHSGLHADARPQIYWHHAQAESASMGIVLRTGGRPLDFANIARENVHAMNPTQPLSNVRPLEELVDRSTANRRFSMLLLTAFATVALLLAAIGIYGVTAYSVSQRTSEMGLRIALGAQPKDVLALVLRESLGRVAFGMALGLTGAVALTRLLSSPLFHVAPLDPATFAAAFALLLAMAGVAAIVPGKRATRVDPTVALRWE